MRLIKFDKQPDWTKKLCPSGQGKILRWLNGMEQPPVDPIRVFVSGKLDGANRQQLIDLGIEIGLAGNESLDTCSIAFDQFESVCSLDFVSHIEWPKRLRPL